MFIDIPLAPFTKGELMLEIIGTFQKGWILVDSVIASKAKQSQWDRHVASLLAMTKCKLLLKGAKWFNPYS